MRLNLPVQIAPTATSTPSGPRKLKKFLSVKPRSCTGELAEQILQILRDFNRHTKTGKHHLQNLEIQSLLSGEFLNSLKIFFVNRQQGFPDITTFKTSGIA